MSVFRYLKNINKKGIQILLYHRVADVESDPQQLCVSQENFHSQINYIKQHYEILKLSDLKEILITKHIPKNGLIITFDDGYEDNFKNAKPILEEFNVPATFFITSGFIGENKEFYQETLNRIFFLEKRIPLNLTIKIENKTITYENLLNEENRNNAYRNIHFTLRGKNSIVRRKAIKELLKWSKIGDKPDDDYKNLNEAQLKLLSKNHSFEIGAHSVNHIPLSSLSIQEQKEEIFYSKAELEKIIEEKISFFAYPYGTKEDYNEETLKIMSQSDFALSCANYPGIVKSNTNIHEIPRVVVRDINVEKFSKFITNNFHKY
tara:strand:+ start:256 stop:1215 length:960 start_codon:yes stop_codon:yes gene_type:complete